MVPKFIFIAAVWLVARPLLASDVTGYLTVISDGDRKDKRLGNWTDDKRYDVHQDTPFRLLKRMDPIAVRSRLQTTGWQVVLDPNQPRQRIDGLGAALTDSSAYVLHQLKQRNAELYEFTMQRLFASDGGAGFSYLRRPIGSSDYTATDANYTCADQPSDDLNTFSIDHDRRYIIPVLKDILAINPDLKIMGTPWSPPGWMKTNGRMNGITRDQKANGATNRLQEKYFSLYADYFVRFIQAYAREGITINAVTLQNEPQFDTAAYPCLRMTMADQIRLVKELGLKFSAADIDTKIFVHDHNWRLHDDDRNVVGGDAKMDPLDLVVGILSDDEASRFVAGSAWHCYAGNEADMRRVYTTIRKQFPDKAIYCTESTGWGKQRGSWFGDVRWGWNHNWLGGLDAGAAVSLQWNLALDHKFGPTLRHDSEAMGLVTINTDTWQDVKFEREFYAMAHVSMAAPPGARPVQTELRKSGSQVTEAPLTALGFLRSDGDRSLCLMNSSDSAETLEVSCGGKCFDLTLPAKSMATLLWAK